MAIPKFTKLTTTACPLNIENVDTDQIIPARFLKAVERKGFGDNLFRDWRYDKAGNKVDSFPLNDPKFGGEILVAAKNFGCGSSRLRFILLTPLCGSKRLNFDSCTPARS